MKHRFVLRSLSTFGVCAIAACEGLIEDPALYSLGDVAASTSSASVVDAAVDDALDADSGVDAPLGESAWKEPDGASARVQELVGPSDAPRHTVGSSPPTPAEAGGAGDAAADEAGDEVDSAAPEPERAPQPEAAEASLDTRVGAGDLSAPLAGPAPFEAEQLDGEPFKLVKNWDFGANGTIRNGADLDAEFEFHDQFGTIANGTNYGAVTVASCPDTAIGVSGLGLPEDRQPVEDPAQPYREWTSDSMLSYVRPLSSTQQTVSAARHDAGNGSLMAKWSLPNGGALLGRDLLWETRVRMPKPLPGYWFALWTAGALWNRGAEMDVLESFGTPNISANAFHADAVGGSNEVEYASWPNALDQVGVPEYQRALQDWHVWTWVYHQDDSYEIYYDGHEVQHGQIHWTHAGTEDGEPIDMRFLFDFSWGHTQVDDVNIELPASMFPLTYEIDYSRVYLR